MKILICPGNKQTAKSYPHWDRLTTLLAGHNIKGVVGILKEQEIIDLINWCDVWASIDSFSTRGVMEWASIDGFSTWGMMGGASIDSVSTWGMMEWDNAKYHPTI